MKKVAFVLLFGALALMFTGCPDVQDGTKVEAEDVNNLDNNDNDDETGDDDNDGDDGDNNTNDGDSGGITGSTVTRVTNCVSFIEGSRFTASGDYSTDVYTTKRVSVSLASGSGDQVDPVGEAIVFTRPFSGDTKSLYYLLRARNTTSNDYKWVYARGLEFIDDDSSFTKRLDGTMKGHLREIDTDSQTSHNIGLRPGEEGYFFSLTPGRIDINDFNSIDRAELTTSLEVNTGANSHTEVEAEATVLGYRYGERDGVVGLEISVKNTGDTVAKLNRNPEVILMDGQNVTLYHASFSRFPSDGFLDPGETGGFFQAATDLGNVSADKVMIILDFQDPPR